MQTILEFFFPAIRRKRIAKETFDRLEEMLGAQDRARNARRKAMGLPPIESRWIKGN